MSEKKKQQLGMNPSTASNRLVKDLLWNFVQKEGNECFHCKQPMDRSTFSIEHKTPWLDSETPIELFFDIDNISFSHLSCNASNARRESLTEAERKTRKKAYDSKKVYNPEKRKEKYLRLGT